MQLFIASFMGKNVVITDITEVIEINAITNYNNFTHLSIIVCMYLSCTSCMSLSRALVSQRILVVTTSYGPAVNISSVGC